MPVFTGMTVRVAHTFSANFGDTTLNETKHQTIMS